MSQLRGAEGGKTERRGEKRKVYVRRMSTPRTSGQEVIIDKYAGVRLHGPHKGGLRYRKCEGKRCIRTIEVKKRLELGEPRVTNNIIESSYEEVANTRGAVKKKLK